MAIYGIGAFYDHDVSQDFITRSIVGVGWDLNVAPELHHFIRTLKVGDIVYIKACPLATSPIAVKAIGLIRDDAIRTHQDTQGLVRVGRNVQWITTRQFQIPHPTEKNNVRTNTMYEEFHPEVQNEVMTRLLTALLPAGSAPQSVQSDSTSQR